MKHILQIVKIIVQLLVVTLLTANVIYILIDLFDGMEYDSEYELAGEGYEI